MVDYLPRITCDGGRGCRSEVKLLACGEGVRDAAARNLVARALIALVALLGWRFEDEGRNHVCPRCQ